MSDDAPGVVSDAHVDEHHVHEKVTLFGPLTHVEGGTAGHHVTAEIPPPPAGTGRRGGGSRAKPGVMCQLGHMVPAVVNRGTN